MKRRILSVIIALALCVSLYPTGVLAEESVSGSCTHHTEHTAECGYAEAQPCTHEHTEEKHSTEEEHSGEECYKTVTECVHEHTDECYPETEETEESTGKGNATPSDAGNREPSLCTHVCSEESGCITKILDCHHEHDESCGYKEAQDCGYVCEICNGTKPEDTKENTENTEASDTDTAECICETLCTEDSINEDCSVCGAEGADLSSCKGEKTEVQEVTGEKVITAWEWIDPEEYLTDGILALPGAGRENPAFVEDVTALLPEKIQAKVAAVNAAEDGEETEEDAEAAPETEDAEITLTGWKCASYPEDGAYEGTYTFTAFLPEGFVLAEDAAALEVEVELGGGEMLLRGGESVVYQKAAWDESKSEVVCTEETADSCTPVENSAAAVTWYNGWYVVNGNVTISEPITVSGEVNLILVDGCTLTAEKGIVVTTGNSLTIYAQSGGTGTLNATGTTDSSNNASAGIGGSTTIFDSGSITIHGGVINATGGASRWYSGAGIGGSTPSSGNGGNSGTIKIYGGTITAESRGFSVGAGIGGGGSGGTGNGGAGTNISIYGGNITAMSYSDNNGGAGIGGGSGQTNGGTGNITIGGGTIHSTGGSLGAGIGGGSGGTQSGNGTVTISGGKVTAVGGNYAAGIGGGGGTKSQYLTWIGGIGSVTITGGIVDAKGNGSGEYAGAPIGNGGNTTATATVNKTTGIVFENGAGTVCGDVTLDGSYTVPADYTLNIPAGASLSGSGTLSGGSAFTTENLTEDMISVPEDWHYTGEDLTEKIKGAVSLNGEVTICGQTFTASTDGWELSVEKVSELEYTVKYTHTGKGTLSKTVTIARGQTALSDVVTYKEDGTTPANTFSVGETIIVKATATFPANNAIMAAAEFDTPAGEQMAVYYDNIQISAPSTVENGVHTMTVDTSNLPESALNKEIGLTVKYIESGNASGATATTNVTVTAVARVKKDSTTTYVGALADAFTEGNSGATVTLLSEVDLGSNYIGIRGSSTFTLDLNGQTVKASHYGAFYISGGSLTIQDSGTGGKIESSNITIEVTGGTLSIKSGTVSGYYGVQITRGTVNISGGVISGTEHGLWVNGGGNIVLSGGAYSGRHAIWVDGNASVTMKDMLAPGYAYHQNDIPIAKAKGLVGDEVGEVPLDAKPAWLTGTVTVKACTHTGEGVCTYTHNENASTHTKTCLACGQTLGTENCTYTFSGGTGTCAACGDSVTVSVTDNLIYDGTEKKPEVTVTRGETALTAGTDYTVVYADNIDAGTAAKVTVTIGNNQGTYNGSFTIGKATPTIAWSSTSQELTYTDQQAVITAPTVTLENNENFGGTISYSYKKQGETDYKDGLPTDAGTYTVKAHVDAEGNYNAADSTNELTLTIKKADTEITVGTAAYDVNYGDPAFTISGVTDTNPETAVQYAVTEGTDVISVSNGTVTIKNAGTATITVSLPETANYNAAANKTITVTVAKKGGYTVSEINKKYYYDRENTAEINLASLLPRDCGTVTYGEPVITSGNMIFTAKAVENGVLSYTLAKGNVNDAGTITVTITTRNYEEITVTVKAVLTDQIPVELKEGTEVTLANTILTYGESLSGLGFNNAVFVDGDGKTVEGILAWKDAAAKPSAGTTSAVWVFIPTDNAYAPVEGTAAITVNKAVPTVSAVPIVADRIYNPSVTLKGDDLTGATVTGVDGNTLKGGWNWQSADIVPTVNNNGYAAIFTPEDTTNYETVTRTITVNVAKATPYIAKSPAAAGITYGDTLNASALSGGTVQYGNGAGQAGDGAGSTAAVAGTFTWKEPSAKPVVADSNVTEYTVVLTPSDTANYNPVEAKVTLTVNKAQNAPNMPGSTMDVSNSLEKVGDVSLPQGWEWQASDQDTALEVGKTVSAVAVYAGADKGNYENETVTVAITRSACDHVAGEILYTGAGEKAPACTEDGLGHRECTKCGSVVESGIVVKAPGHTGGTATCSKRAVCTRCGQPYGDTDGSVHGDTEVRGFVAATCTAGGYTGDTYCKDCGAKTKTGNATPALGHNYTSTVTKEPTTGSEGTRTYTCTRCGHSYTESIPKLPEETHHHSYSGSVTKQPTCTDTGIRTYTCSCGDSYTETIAALGHHYQSSVTKQPTATAEGVMTYTCIRCGHSYTRPIAKLPGEGTTDPGTGQPGETGSGSGSTETRPDTGIPFIKGGDGKTGWDVIRAEEEKAQEGSTINVDMNGTTVVPGDIFDSIRGRDITVTFDMGGGILWSVNGKEVITDKAGDIDFSVKTETNAIPVDIVNNVTGERYSIQISLAHEGEFGFKAVLSIGLGKENAGYTASLYHYNQSIGELEFICADTVAEDGTVSLAFTHASDYVIAIDGEEESGNATEPEQPDTPDKDSTAEAESPKTGQAWRPWWFIVVGALVIVMGIGVFLAVRKKQEAENS
ncbi:hypothetical protein [uncultured Acetatifactor sp.]|uniref:hypothetical protein n=1 Tax=uncultured Acetatifactor sp. TaxID=1671927 RepID=UPI0026036499|nr:hypothetical protein [uncultured Acetatifactor sp.]